ncbi:MAG: hypothetical protein LBI64_02530 [Coriobacteriales bacterium]|jgi:cell division protein FtsL|nr:hypothetical protein [Coriobacteriales bacterium]
MAQAAQAYQRTAGYSREQDIPARPDLRVLPGRGRDRAASVALSPQLRALFGVLIFAVIFLAGICALRVAMANATLQVLVDTQSLERSIAEERARGIELEMQYSILANPEYIQTLASEQLGMAPDEQVEYLRPTSEE